MEFRETIRSRGVGLLDLALRSLEIMKALLHPAAAGRRLPSHKGGRTDALPLTPAGAWNA